MLLFCFLGICHAAPKVFVRSMFSLRGGSELFYVLFWHMPSLLSTVMYRLCNFLFIERYVSLDSVVKLQDMITFVVFPVHLK